MIYRINYVTLSLLMRIDWIPPQIIFFFKSVHIHTVLTRTSSQLTSEKNSNYVQETKLTQSIPNFVQTAFTRTLIYTDDGACQNSRFGGSKGPNTTFQRSNQIWYYLWIDNKHVYAKISSSLCERRAAGQETAVDWFVFGRCCWRFRS